MKERRHTPELLTPWIISDPDINGRDRTHNYGVPIIGISRHRIGTDGHGVTTLVAFHGCPLRCRYCINPQCFGSADNLPRYTPENLYAELQKDDLYFRATGGGVTFGGGEPCLQSDFIVRFREICGHGWKINIETSLNVDREHVVKLAPVVDEWIVDIKTDDHARYLEYTGKDIKPALRKLYYLVNVAKIPKDRILLRIPVIPGFIDAEQAESTRQRFADEGFYRFDIFSYRTHRPQKNDGTGKEKCRILRRIREEITALSGSTLPPHDCPHTGDCPGTCARCESELKTLNQNLRENGGIRTPLISTGLSECISSFSELPAPDDETAPETDAPSAHELEGMIPDPEKIYRKIFVKECPVAGLSFHLKKGDDLWNELEEGTPLALVRDRNNKYDRNAVAVALADDYDGDPDDFDFDFILGYLPRTENAEIAAMIDAGYTDKFSAEITTLKQHGSYSDRLRITICIESREPVTKRPDLLRIEHLSDSEYSHMIAELKSQGFATFRWGGFPPEERNLPEAGDKIIMLHEEKDCVALHLMHVLMSGDDCLKLGLDPDLIHFVDDCLHFVLTNVNGPLTLSHRDLSFLSRHDPERYYVPEYLTPEESDALKHMFGITHAINDPV